MLHVHLFQIIKVSKLRFEPRVASWKSTALPYEQFDLFTVNWTFVWPRMSSMAFPENPQIKTLEASSNQIML